MNEPALSVAICTRNRSESLAVALASLEQTPSSLPWELLVIDNASEDDTSARLNQIKTKFPATLRILFEAEAGLSKARNLALREARGSAVLFLDDDVTCEPGVVEAHIKAFEHPSVHATGGRIIPLLPPETPQWFQDEVFANPGGPTARYDFGDDPMEVGVEIRPVPIGAHFGIRRQIALDHGGFDEALGCGPRAMLGEETHLLDQVSSKGGRILYIPDAVVHHRISIERTTFAYFDQWYERLGRFEAIRPGRPTGINRWKAITRASIQYGKWSFRSFVERDSTQQVKIQKRLARARGRCLELATPGSR